MTTSFRDVSSRYDRLYAPTSLRVLGGRVRYPGVVPGDLPPGPVSLAAISRVRRRPFRRAGAPSEPEYFLSDHLGLEISLYARLR